MPYLMLIVKGLILGLAMLISAGNPPSLPQGWRIGLVFLLCVVFVALLGAA